MITQEIKRVFTSEGFWLTVFLSIYAATILFTIIGVTAQITIDPNIFESAVVLTTIFWIIIGVLIIVSIAAPLIPVLIIALHMRGKIKAYWLYVFFVYVIINAFFCIRLVNLITHTSFKLYM